MRVIGMNPNAGRYSGMNIPVNSILSMFLAGGFAGLGGIINIIGLGSTSLQRAFPITLASAVLQWPFLWVRNWVGIIVSGILFGALNAGGVKMQMLAKVPSASIYMIQGMIIILLSAGNCFIWFAGSYRKKKTHGVTGGENHG